MNWTQALALEIVVPQMDCSLTIVGETKEGLPFCYEDSFTLQKVNADQIIAAMNFSSDNPLEKLHHVCFIEILFRERGILYYAFVDLLNRETGNSSCTLTLAAPPELSKFENRRFRRIKFPSGTPLTFRIVGAHKTSSCPDTVLSGLIQDISGGGLSFITNTRILYPLHLELAFVLPGSPDHWVLHAEMVRVSYLSAGSYQIAVEFRNIPESLTHQIDEYCCSRTIM